MGYEIPKRLGQNQEKYPHCSDIRQEFSAHLFLSASTTFLSSITFPKVSHRLFCQRLQSHNFF